MISSAQVGRTHGQSRHGDKELCAAKVIPTASPLASALSLISTPSLSDHQLGSFISHVLESLDEVANTDSAELDLHLGPVLSSCWSSTLAYSNVPAVYDCITPQ